ncbi:hypothetical protein D9Q98_007079 [Chlorella vulgaris]|uniref:Secreted protein n=1 Tax=Chlorella vulgaris TaxID=3077 RepID=A0A9D4YUG3_CHLVU|nr:hypothetical protein D9Q98_007079 [Chlorella vulgaris]
MPGSSGACPLWLLRCGTGTSTTFGTFLAGCAPQVQRHHNSLQGLGQGELKFAGHIFITDRMLRGGAGPNHEQQPMDWLMLMEVQLQPHRGQHRR